MADQGEPAPGAPRADDYQARYMSSAISGATSGATSSATAALYHDKIKAPLGYHVIFFLPLFTVVATALAGKMPLVLPLASVAVLLLAWLLFSVLRITVSEREVFVQYGLFGPRIPVADITRCEAVAYDWDQYGGWGIRYGRDGSRAYNMLGDRGRAVRIAYKKGKNEQVVLLSSRDPGRLAASIEEARAAVAAKMPVASVPVVSVEATVPPALTSSVEEALPAKENEAHLEAASRAESKS